MDTVASLRIFAKSSKGESQEYSIELSRTVVTSRKWSSCSHKSPRNIAESVDLKKASVNLKFQIMERTYITRGDCEPIVIQIVGKLLKL